MAEGASWDLQFIEAPPDEYICSECKFVLRKPMVAKCCNLHFCEGCTEDPYAMTVGFDCPRCRRQDVDVVFDGFLWKRILELKVRCPFSERGCRWTGELGSKRAHTDPLHGDCNYADKDCRHGCGQRLNDKDELIKHMEHACPKRSASCPHCNENGIYDYIHGKHIDECPITCIGKNMEQYQLDFAQKLPVECICRHCKHVLRKPMLTECCEEHFCASCIEDPYSLYNTQYNCSECGILNISASLDNNKWKEILMLHVRCPFTQRGCRWSGELGKRGAHLDIEDGDCKHVEIDCTKKCGEKVAIKDLAEHLHTTCPRREQYDSDYCEPLDCGPDYVSDKVTYECYTVPDPDAAKELRQIRKRNHDIAEFVHPPPKEYICPKCANVFAWPMLTGCCSKHLCAMCIENQHAVNEDVYTKYECPHCGRAGTFAILAKRKWEKIQMLQIKCIYVNNGCYWVGELREREKHIEECDYHKLECSHKCGEQVERYKLSEHEIFCPKRPVTCKHCNEKGEQEFINGEHINKCPEYPVNCPNNCGKEGIKRKDLTQHLSECPEEIIECPYSYAGCDEQIRRKSFLIHQEECLEKHLGLNEEFFRAELTKRDTLLQGFVHEKKYQFLEIAEEYDKQIKELQNLVKELHQADNVEIEKLVCQIKSKYDHIKWNANKIVYSNWEIQRSMLEITSTHPTDQETIENCRGKYLDKQVIIKKLKRGSPKETFLQEAHVLMKLDHENIIKLLGVVTSSEPVLLVLECMMSRNFRQYLTVSSYQQQETTISMCKQVALGLDYMQKKLCLHRNISIETVYVRDNSTVQIGDFSFAIILDHFTTEHIVRGNEILPLSNLPPEVLSSFKYCLKSDVWCYGMFLQQVISTCIAKSKRTKLDLDMTTKTNEYHMTTNAIYGNINTQVYPDQIHDIMGTCQNANPASRPTFEEVVALLDKTLGSESESGSSSTSESIYDSYL